MSQYNGEFIGKRVVRTSARMKEYPVARVVVPLAAEAVEEPVGVTGLDAGVVTGVPTGVVTGVVTGAVLAPGRHCE